MDALIQLLEQHNVPYRLAGQDKHVSKQGWIGMPCPWCGGGGFYFGIRPGSGKANCWKCGGRSASAGLALLCGVTDREAQKALGHRVGPAEPRKAHQGVLQRPKGVGPLLPAHRRYLEGRGFDPDELVRIWKIGGIGPEGKLKWRIFIPIFDSRGREVSWTSRTIGPSGRRYHSAGEQQEAVPHKDLLYGGHLARQSVVIVEGPIDAWAIGPGAVATCGTSVTPAQVAAMLEYPVRIVCFDSTDEAQERAGRLCSKLSMFAGQTENVLLETGDDAADADRDEIEELRSKYLGLVGIGES
jgi:hypothetical protein